MSIKAPPRLLCIYLFNAGQERIADGVSDPTVITAFQDANAAIKQAEQLDLYRNLQLLKQYGVTVPRTLKEKGNLPFLVASYSYLMKNNPKPVYSKLYVTGLHNLVFKVRVTQGNSAQPSDADMKQLLTMMVAHFDRQM